jgi:NTP pyrophosphatase (non-canonical NTP hydrolase)|tara:strand:+ start:207 stop:623 length:417 start_codon:yes stop_codon:yes gene_type:complete
MTKQIDPQKYVDFVEAVTSKESKDYISFNSRCFEIQSGDDGLPVHRLLTAALGICAEGGEFTEVVKKIVFQGKPVNEENLFHMKRELGDIMWYMAQACMALNTNFNEILEMNVDKLSSRYPDGTFDVHYSENRKEGDV